MERDALILITNDDGVNAPGLRELVEVAKEFGHVVVVAPDGVRSGMSHAITMYKPLTLRAVERQEGVEIYACNGTPVDCVKMALDHLLIERKIDLLLSGINHGSNAAINVHYSGTMGAALEGAFYGIPSVGFSILDHSESADFSASKVIARDIMSKFVAENFDQKVCLNVNIPIGSIDQIKGVKVCRQCGGFWQDRFLRQCDPRGKEYFWMVGEFSNSEPFSTDTDMWALDNGYVSVVPLEVDLTNRSQISMFKGVIE